MIYSSDIKYKFNNCRTEFKETIDRLLDCGEYVLGSTLKKFELNVAKYLNVKYTIGVGTGTAALELGIRSLNLPPGSEVITSPMSYLASTSAIYLAGLKPVFSDIDDSLNLCPVSLENKINEKTTAILVVHLGGVPAQIKSLLKIAKKYNLKIIEDCAQAFGSKHKKNFVGTFGDVAALSFHPLKTLGTIGDGGMILTNKKRIYDNCIKSRNHGHYCRDDINFFSDNSRLDDIHAGFLQVQLKQYDKVIKYRNDLAKRYKERLNRIVLFPVINDCDLSVYSNFMIIVKNRRRLIKHLNKESIETKIHYPKLINKLRPLKNLNISNNNADYYVKRILTIPLGKHITKSIQNKIILSINQFYEKYH
jgi:UDP-2-acetamido-2-deoxy-ribo-hexuluronate aminotransferase